MAPPGVRWPAPPAPPRGERLQPEHPAATVARTSAREAMYNRGVLPFTRVALAGLVFIAAATRCSTAHANGRFPEAQTFESAPGTDGKTVFLRTTFGVLVSRDRGEHWRWICERALGYGGQWDPAIAVTRDGR